MKKKISFAVAALVTVLSSCAQNQQKPVEIPRDSVRNAPAPAPAPAITVTNDGIDVGNYYPTETDFNEIVPPKVIVKPVKVEYLPEKKSSKPSGHKTHIQKKFYRLSKHVHQYWGKGTALTASNHQFVKYLDKYQSRAHIDFINNKLTVSTVDPIDAKSKLHKAIVQALLMPDNPNEVDLFSDSQIELQGTPFLLGQIKDQDNKDIRWQWRANRFADYLIEHQLKKQKIDGKTQLYVDVNLTKDSLKLREYKYSPIVRKASIKYDIPEDLLYAIIKTESGFNPFAVSHAGAYGLMQVIPSTAGADVFKRLKHRNDKPTSKYLFNVYNNIDTGAGYFYILKNQYFKGVKNEQNLIDGMICAYNGGAGAVYKVFSRQHDTAVSRLNKLPHHIVYKDLTTKHPQQETRNYLKKVTKYKRDFNQGVF